MRFAVQKRPNEFVLVWVRDPFGNPKAHNSSIFINLTRVLVLVSRYPYFGLSYTTWSRCCLLTLYEFSSESQIFQQRNPIAMDVERVILRVVFQSLAGIRVLRLIKTQFFQGMERQTWVFLLENFKLTFSMAFFLQLTWQEVDVDVLPVSNSFEIVRAHGFS